MTPRNTPLRTLLAITALLVGGAALAGPVDDTVADGVTQIELSIWRTPEFRRRFARSLVAETPVEPSVNAREQETLSEVMDLVARNDVDGALAVLGEARSARSSAALDFMAGNLQYLQGRLDEAAAALTVAVGKHPNFRRAWIRLGDLEARRDRPEAAVLALTRAFELGATDPFTLGLLGWSQARLGRWVSAETAYRRAIMLDPESYEWRDGLVEALLQQRREGDAIALLEMLVAERPGDASLWRRLGEAKLAGGRPDEAAQDLEVVRELGGGDATVLGMLGDIYLERRIAGLAVARHVAAIETGEASAVDAAFEAAKVLLEQGELAPVADLLESVRVRRLDTLGDDARASYGRLSTVLAARRSEGRVEAEGLEAIVERNPLDGEALILLGRHHARQDGGIERAEYWFERAEGLPDFEVDARIAHAEALVSLGRFGDAAALLRQAQSLRSNDAVAAYLSQIESYARSR